MSDDLNPLEIDEIPEEFIENEDGSVEIPIEGEFEENEGDFLENLAERFSDATLNYLSSELVDLIEKDKKSREKRDKQYEEGLRPARRSRASWHSISVQKRRWSSSNEGVQLWQILKQPLGARCWALLPMR